MEVLKNFEVSEDFRQSDEYGKYLESINWNVVQINNTKVFVKRLGPVSICKIQRYIGEIGQKELKHILKEYRVIRIIWEPLKDRTIAPVNKEPLLATKTIRIDLRKCEKELFESFQKDCRYILRKFKNYKLQTTKNDFDRFYKIWNKSGKRLNIWIPNKKEFDNMVKCFGKKIYCITIDDKAGCLVITHKQTAFYYYAGATREGTRENLPYLLVWKAMLEAQERGAKIWDFEGIFDARWPDKRWKGFSHFKKSFGGKEIEYPGSFAKWRWPF